MMIVEVDTENGFWFGGLFWSKDQHGNPLRLSKNEYDQMIINGDVIVLDD